MGYATTPGRTEVDQAGWWLRAIATFAAEPRIEGIGIYEIKDLPRDRAVIGDTPNYHLGLTDVDRRKKLAFGTVARVIALLGPRPASVSRPSLRVSAPGTATDVHRHLFTRDDGRRVLFVWTRTDDVTIDVQIGGGAAEAIEYGMDGGIAGPVPVSEGWLRGIALRSGDVRFFEMAR
jgi:hypothetical protein